MAQTQKSQTIRRTLHYYWQAAKAYPGALVGMFVTVTTGAVLGGIIYYYLISQLINGLSQLSVGATTPHHLYVLFGWAAAIDILGYLAWRANSLFYLKQQALVLRSLENMTFGRVMQHSYRFFVTHFGGAIVNQFNRFVKGFEALEDTFFFEIYTMAVRIVASIIVLALTAPWIAISLLVWVILFVTSVAWLTVRKMPHTKREAAASTHQTAGVADAITNAINIKIFARTQYERTRFRRLSQDLYERRRYSWRLDEFIRAYQGVLMVIFELMIIGFSIRFVISGTLSVGIVLLAQFYISRVFGDLWNLSNVMRRIERAFSEAAEMTEILDQEIEVKDPVKPEALRIKDGEIVFDDVTFRYEQHANRVFENFSLTIPAGEKIGLVGHSGSGKTTLTKLIFRFGDLEAGEIRIDGQNIANLRQEDLRSQIAYVPQEPILFHRSLMENIRYGRLDASDEEVYEAARLAHADEFINQLPDGYETLVGERGVKLSGGEKQRVAIARAMLSRAPILLLDEATSALDSKSEKLIAAALDNLMKGRTTIVIAHRLSTIRRLDRILVMHHGQIVEEGRHEELLQRDKGVYQELWSHQSGDFIAE